MVKTILGETLTHRYDLILNIDGTVSLIIYSKLLNKIIDKKIYDAYSYFIENQPFEEIPKL